MDNFADLAGFLAVADTGHVGAAAAQLGISQPALTRRIQRLEKTLGAQLFERTGRTLRLNARGQAFVPHAQNIVDTWRAGRDEVARLMDPERGTVRLDFMHSLGTWLVPDLVRKWRSAHPHVQFHLHQGPAKPLVDRVRAGKCDIALVGPRPESSRPESSHPESSRPEDPSVAWHPLKSQRLGLAVPEGHWAAGRASVDITEFEHEPFIGMLPGYGTRMLLDALTAEAGFQPRLVFESMELTTVAGLVTAGLGSALLPLDDPYLGVDNLIPITPARYRELGMVWRPGTLGPAAENFRRFVGSLST